MDGAGQIVDASKRDLSFISVGIGFLCFFLVVVPDEIFYRLWIYCTHLGGTPLGYFHPPLRILGDDWICAVIF